MLYLGGTEKKVNTTPPKYSREPKIPNKYLKLDSYMDWKKLREDIISSRLSLEELMRRERIMGRVK